MKKLVAMLLCLAMLLSLTAFAAAEEKTTVVFWYSLEGTNAECIKQIVDDFNKSQDKIFVDAQYQGAYDDAINKLKAAGMGQLPCDIVHSYEIGTRFIIDSGWIVPVQEYIDKDNWDTSAIEPNLLAYYTVDGKINSMPFNCSTPLMYYNKTAFDEAGITEIPTTVDGILEIADKLTVKNPDGSIAVIHCTADLETGNGNPADGRKVKGNNGTGRTSYATKVMFGENGAALDIFNMWKKISESKATYYVERGGTSAARAAFVAGDAAIFLASTANLAGVLANVGTNFEVGTAYFPYVNADDKGGVSTGGGTQAKEAAAFEFIKFCVNPENQAKWNAMTGYFPINVHAQETDTFKANIEKYPQFQTALDQLHDSAPEYVGSLLSVFPEVRQYVEDVTEKVCQGTLTPEAAVEELVKLANDAIETYNLVNY